MAQQEEHLRVNARDLIKKGLAVDSLTFKTLSVNFGADMQTILEDLEVAIDGGLDARLRQETVARAKGKLARYGEILAELASLEEKRRQFEGRFGEAIEEIRSSLLTLK